MRIPNFLAGLVCFLIIILYWYCVPYQVWLTLGLLTAEATAGFTFQVVLGLIITMSLGFFISTVLAILAIVIWRD